MFCAAVFVELGCTRVLWQGHSQDRKQALHIESRGGRQQLYVDGQARGPRVRRIALQSLHFNPSVDCMVYAARERRRWYVYHQGRAGPAWRAISPIIVGDHCRVVYAGRDRGAWHLIDDERVGPSYQTILAESIQVGEARAHVAYAVHEGGSFRVRHGGELGPSWDGVAQLTLRSGATDRPAHITYIGRRGQQRHVIHGTAIGPGYQAIAELAVGRWSPGLSRPRFAYFGQRRGRWHVVVDGVELASAPAFDRLQFSPDGHRLAYLRRDAQGRDHVVVDGQIHPSHGRVRALQFSQNSRHLSYIARSPLVDRLVRDGKPGPGFAVIDSYVESDGGQHWAYLGIDHDIATVMIDGQAHGRVPMASQLRIDSLGKHWALISRGQRDAVVLDGQVVGTFDHVLPDSLSFGPLRTSGQPSWGCVAGDSNLRKLFFIADGSRGRSLELAELIGAQQRAGAKGPLLGLDLLGSVALRDWVHAEISRALPTTVSEGSTADLTRPRDPPSLWKSGAKNLRH